MNRRNIVQYKPKGPANIFAPTIRINGMNPKFSNDGNFYSMYPPSPTVPYDRQMSADSDFRSNHFNELYDNLFEDLIQPTERPYQGRENYNVGGYTDADDNLGSSLQNAINCINKGANCTEQQDCHPDYVIGRCLPGMVCCNDTREPGENQNQTYNPSNFGSNTVTGTGTAQSQAQAAQAQAQSAQAQSATAAQATAAQATAAHATAAQATAAQEQVINKKLYIIFDINYDNLDTSIKNRLRQKVLEHIKNLYLNKIKPELSSMSLNIDNISVIKKILTAREKRLPSNQQKSTQVNVTIGNIELNDLNKIRDELTTYLNDPDDNTIIFRIGNTDHKSIKVTTTLLTVGDVAEQNENNNVSYYGNEKRLRNEHSLSTELQRLRREFGGNVGQISNPHCTQFCGRKLVTHKINVEGVKEALDTPYYEWRQECNTSQMRRTCRDCPVCHGVDANDANIDGVEDVKVVDPNTIQDWKQRDVIIDYQDSL